ncbi:hypothetical protein HPB51_002766 [Rhipicephalus microplus]|uniref:Uncharacterized protein n=1 Tax=Rhipicephalus microplus TaxID=6941 RepID=A0A9J6DKR8_RHIMP|nr:hypothetical protein HPB51_002766 [Rhipicephalus microplus]
MAPKGVNLVPFYQVLTRAYCKLPVAVSLNLKDRSPYRQPWRVDNRLLSDETSRASLRNRLTASIGNFSWDGLKQEWRKICTDKGKKLKHRYSGLVRATLQRIRIVERGKPTSLLMKTYANNLKLRATGVTNQSWEEEVKTLKQDITRALEFNFPYYVRRYLLMGVFTGRLWFLTNSAAMPYRIASKVKSQIIRFFRKAKTALVKYEQLGLPREKGGWNIPSVVALADTYALKTTLKVLQLQEEHPARKLATYFLGVQGRLFLQTQPAGPKAINPTPFYRHVVGIYKRIAALNLDTPILEVRNTELTQELLVN